MSSPHFLTVLMCFFIFWGCGVKEQPHEEEVTEEEVPVLSRQAAIKHLPCFGCHDAEAFFSKKGKAFSHEAHSMFEVHCSQCHDLKGHEHVRLVTETCNTCHALKTFSYAGGGMGRVAFSHEFHTAMFGCSDCHTAVFPMKKGLSKMKMDAMYQGKSCGSCHNGKKAFSSMECARCHEQG